MVEQTRSDRHTHTHTQEVTEINRLKGTHTQPDTEIAVDMQTFSTHRRPEPDTETTWTHEERNMDTSRQTYMDTSTEPNREVGPFQLKHLQHG